MEQLIFIGIIVAFSILDAIARGKKRQAAQSLQAVEGQEPPPEVHWEPEPVETYDAEPSFDDRVEAGTGAATSQPEPLIPADIWEEIAALARGGTSRAAPGPALPTAPAGQSAPEPPAEVIPARTRYPVPRAARDRPAHAVHDTHPMMGRPLSERLTPLSSGSAHATKRSQEIIRARRMLAGGGMSMRQAVILHEVLGPPAAVRGDPFDPVG